VQSSGPEAPAGTPAAAPAANPPAPSPQPDDAVEATPPNKSASFDAPQLLGPVNDKTAHRPTVDVHNAVYRQPARSTNVSTTVAAKPAMDANGWYGVANR
jgi:hypothetical protein